MTTPTTPTRGNGRGRPRRLTTGDAAAYHADGANDPEVIQRIDGVDAPPPPPGFAKPERSGIRRILKDASNWGEVRKTPYGLMPLVILGLVFFFEVIDSQAFSLAAPDIARDLGISIGQIIGILITVGVLLVPVTLLVGWWADRHSRVKLVGIGVAISGVFAMLSSRARSGTSLGAPRVGDEVFDTGSAVPRYSLLADYYPPEVRGKAFAVLGGFRRTGQLIAPVLAGGIILKLGWRTALVIFGIPIVIIGIIATVRLREPIRGYQERKALGLDDDLSRVEDEPLSFGESWRTIWAVRTLRRVFIADIFGNVESVYSLFFLFFLTEKYHLDAFQRGTVFVPAVIAGLFGNYIGGGLIDFFTRRNPGRVLIMRGLFEAVAALSIIGIAFKPPLAVIVALASLNAFGLSLTGPANNAVYAQVIPANTRTLGLQVFGLASLPTFIIFFPLGSTIFGKYGYQNLFLMIVPVLLTGALVAASAGAFFDLDMRNAFAVTAANEEWRRAKREGKGKLLVCRGVEVEYDGVQVLFGVDFDVEEGEIIALLGTNGAGKSTLLRAISGTQEASSGAIVFDGRDITHMPPHETAGRGVIHMPGGRGVFPGLTVRENLLLGAWMMNDDDEVRLRLAETFEIFPILKSRAGELAQSLSGGEQQMLSLAQAFLGKPRLLMIDELSLGLSPAVVGELLQIVRRIHDSGVTVIVVEQSVNVALTLADKAIFMEKGEVRFFGKTKDLLSRPDILRAVYVKGTGALTDGAPASARRSERDTRLLDLEAAKPILEVQGIVKRYGGVVALNGVSFAVREGETLGVIGPNGSGKTTMFDVISGFQKADGGSVFYEGVEISALSPEARAQKKLVRRFQDARLFGALTVFETLLVALEQRLEVKSTFFYAVQLPAARRAERRLRVRAERLIELLELGAYRDKFVRELSTGLRRIVDLACVLASEPKVLLLDEPSSGIAQAEAEGLGPLLRRVRFETGCSILIIEHDMPLISAVSDELLALEHGTFVTRGSPQEVLNDERVIEAYLGGTEETVKRSGSLV